MKTIFVTVFMALLSAGLVLAEVIPVEPGTDKLSEAMTSASPGDVLELSAGVYQESSTLNTIEGDLTIRGAEDAEVIIYGPTEMEADFMHVYGNLWLENLILVGSDKSINGITNYYGGVEVDGGELTADKNNIYISNCMFLVFVYNHIYQPEYSTDYSDNRWHPIDTLRVRDCLFYGADITNDRAIKTYQRQVRYVEVRNSTFWSLGEDALEVKGGYVGDDSDNPGAGSDLQYITTIADHLTIFNTYNNCPEQAIGRGGDGIHFSWANRKQSITNTIVFRSGRFCFKAKRGESEKTIASYCMGDSANLAGGYSPPTVYYWMMTKGPSCFEMNPKFTDHWNGDFSLQPTSLANGTASDGSNLGDLHWDDSATYWPNKAELAAIIERARSGGVGVIDAPSPTLQRFALYQNYPNPFNATTSIRYTLSEPGAVRIEIYSLTGRRIRTVVDGFKDAGNHTVSWGGDDDRGRIVTSGIYLCRLKSRTGMDTGKLLFIR